MQQACSADANAGLHRWIREIWAISVIQPEALFRFQKFSPQSVILWHMHGVLNVDEKKLIVQLGEKSRDETFEPN